MGGIREREGQGEVERGWVETGRRRAVVRRRTQAQGTGLVAREQGWQQHEISVISARTSSSALILMIALQHAPIRGAVGIRIVVTRDGDVDIDFDLDFDLGLGLRERPLRNLQVSPTGSSANPSPSPAPTN